MHYKTAIFDDQLHLQIAIVIHLKSPLLLNYPFTSTLLLPSQVPELIEGGEKSTFPAFML